MKKNKGLFFLGSSVVILALWAYFGEYKREINETQAKAEATQIIKHKKDQIQKIELKKGEGSPIILERSVEGWNLVAPIQDQADNEIVESLLDQMTGEKSVDQVKVQSGSLEEYGLKPSLGTISLAHNNGQRELIEVSTKKNFEGLVWLKKDGVEELLTSSDVWMSYLTKPLDQLRNLKLFRGSISKVQKISLTNRTGTFNFEYKDGNWVAPQRREWNLDQNAVREIMTQVTSSKGTALLDDAGFKQKGDLLLSLTFGGDGINWKGSLYQDSKSKDVLAQISEPDLRIRHAPQTMEDYRSKKLIDFRDRTEPFRFATSEVVKIVAETLIKSFTLIKKDGVWSLEKPDPQVVVSQSSAGELARKVSRMTVYKFFEKPVQVKGLSNRLMFFDESNKKIFELSFGDFKDHEAYAQTTQFKESFQIDDAQVNHLQLQEIVKPKPDLVEEKVEKKEEKK